MTTKNEKNSQHAQRLMDAPGDENVKIITKLLRYI